MINIIESHMCISQMIHQVIDTAPTFEEAKAKVEAMGALYMEDDADHPNCADALMTDGRCIAIQPEGFKLEGSP